MALATRELGYTESNWCLAIKDGSGITVCAFLFGISLSKATVQAAVNKLLSVKPFLSSRIVTADKKLSFQISKEPVLVEELGNPIVAEEETVIEGHAETWLKIVDLELNIPFPQTNSVPILQVHLYKDLPDLSSLVVIRAHAGACDIDSTSPIGSTFLNSLKEVVEKEKSGESIEALLQKVTLDKEGVLKKFKYYPAIENAIPKGAADKPFWAHGKDVIGYGLVSRRHAYLPLGNTTAQRKSSFIRASLSKEATDRLLKACKSKSSNLYGVISAAGLKSVVTFKKIGNKGEHYGVAVLYNTRTLLDPKLPEDALGFYQSALLKTTHTAENHQFWDVAAKCTKEFQESIKKRKHFTDMGNLNMLMVQAIHHPNLTPAGSLRTAMFSIHHDAVVETTPVDAAQVLQLKDMEITSSIHGVGPCIAIFHFLRDGALHLSFPFCTPLFARHDMQTIADSIIGYLTV